MASENRTLVFRERPKPCAGDMRISWRLSVCLLSLIHSRGKKASLAKMHVLNDALRSVASRQKLTDIIQGELPPVFWKLRVEPAFSRALDFLVGEGFATWEISSGKTSIKLTPEGVLAAKVIEENSEILVDEREFLGGVAKKITEGFIQSLLTTGRQLL